jgi:hypothetical protein
MVRVGWWWIGCVCVLVVGSFWEVDVEVDVGGEFLRMARALRAASRSVVDFDVL